MNRTKLLKPTQKAAYGSIFLWPFHGKFDSFSAKYFKTPYYYYCPDTPTKASTSRAELSECATPSVDPAWMQHALFVATVATHEFFCLWWWPQPEWHTFPVLLQSIFCQHITRGNANTFVWHTATCEGIGKKWDIFYVVHALEMWPELKMNRSEHTVRFSSIRR